MPCSAKLPSDHWRAPRLTWLGRGIDSTRRRWRTFLRFSALGACSLALWMCCGLAQSAEITVRNAQLWSGDDAYSVSAEFGILLDGRVEEAVNKGVVLHFAVDFEVTRSRWYWFDEQVVRRQRSMQLAYLALTRQYRVSTGNQHQTYATLAEALRAMASLAPWGVVDKAWVKPELQYEAALQMRLDLSQMPKTFQVSALSNKDWALSSGWWRWVFVPRDARPVPAPAAERVPTPGVVPRPEVPVAPSLSSPVTGPASAEPLRLPTITPSTEVK